MLKLPEKTLYNRKIPKNKFYEKIKANSKLKDKFTRQIDSIVWKHKLSKQTMNIEPTEEIQEIQIFEIYLKQKELSKELLENIDRAIPYPILFVLKYNDEAKLTIAYKQRNKNDENKFVIDSYYESEWTSIENLSIDISSGLNLQTVYENIIKSLISVEAEKNDSIQEIIEFQKNVDQLRYEISKLESKMRNEKQFNKKVKLNMELQNKKKELEEELSEQ
jgi:hypothetical protein